MFRVVVIVRMGSHPEMANSKELTVTFPQRQREQLLILQGPGQEYFFTGI